MKNKNSPFFRRTRALILILALLVFPTSAAGAEDYINSFDTSGSLDGASITVADGEVSAHDGVLTVKGSETYPPLTAVLLPHREGEDEYTVDFSLYCGGDGDAEAWFGLIFAAEDDTSYYQLTLKPHTSDPASAELLKRTGEYTYQTLKTCSLSDFVRTGAISADKLTQDYVMRQGVYFDFRIAVKDSAVFAFVDGELICEYIADGELSGAVGISAYGMTVVCDTVAVGHTLPEIKSVFGSYNTQLYLPSTALANPPIVLQTDSAVVTAFQSAQRPAVMIYNARILDGVMYAFSVGSKTGTLDERLAVNDGYTLHAFSVSDSATAAALPGYLQSKGIYDCYIISADPELLKTAKGADPYRRAVLDYSAQSSVNGDEVFAAAEEGGCGIVILSERGGVRDTVRSLQKHMLTVFVKSSTGDSSYHNAIMSGANGIITDDGAAAVRYIQSFTQTAVVRAPQIIGDCARDFSVQTVTAMAETGVGAVVIPADGAETLGELYRAVRTAYPELMIIVRAEERSDVDAIVSEAERSGMNLRTVILTGNAELAAYAAEAGDNISVQYETAGSPSAQTDANMLVFGLEDSLRRFNSAYHGTWSGMPAELMAYASCRGLTAYPYPVTSSSEAEIYFSAGYDGIKTEKPSLFEGFPDYLTASLSDDGELSVTMHYVGGADEDVTQSAELHVISGTPVLEGAKVSGEGTFAVRCRVQLPGMTSFHIYSTTLRTGAEQSRQPALTDVPTPAEGDGAFPPWLIAVCAAAVLLGVTSLLVIRSRSGKKKTAHGEK